MIAPCVDCGRLTAEEEGSCSHCQQRKQAKEMAAIKPEPSKLDYWKDRANKLASKSGKLQVVVDYGNGSCQVWPKTLVSKNWNIVYEAGNSLCV